MTTTSKGRKFFRWLIESRDGGGADAHFFDDRDPSTETEAWQNWLDGRTA